MPFVINLERFLMCFFNRRRNGKKMDLLNICDRLPVKAVAANVGAPSVAAKKLHSGETRRKRENRKGWGGGGGGGRERI